MYFYIYLVFTLPVTLLASETLDCAFFANALHTVSVSLTVPVTHVQTQEEAYAAVINYLKRYVETAELDNHTLAQITAELHTLLQPLIRLDTKRSKAYAELSNDLQGLCTLPTNTMFQRGKLKAACLSAFNKHISNLPNELQRLLQLVKKKASGL